MSNIKRFNSFINENYSDNKITDSNFLDYKDKIYSLVLNEENPDLKKAFEFTVKNIVDYSDDDFVKELIDPFLDKLNIIIDKKYPKFWKSEDKGYSGNKFTGSKYELTKDMDRKELSKLIKKELNIEFPDWQFSVKGYEITVYITDIPYNPYSEKVDYAYKNNTSYNLNRRDEIYNDQYLKDYEKIQHIVNQYNFDDSDSNSDYFHTRYSGSVSLDSGLIKKKFYPENDEVKKSEEFSKEWNQQRAKAKEIADSKKGKFKKGDNIIYTYNKENKYIPKGEYKGIILKAPNGRAFFSKYEIRFIVNKGFDKEGGIVELERPRTYETTLYNENEIRLDENK